MASQLLTHTWVTTIKNDSGAAVVGATVVITGSNEFNEKVGIAAGETAEIDCGSINKDKITSIFLNSDQDVTVDTNDATGSTGQEIALKAKAPWAWHNALPVANPVTTSITKIFVTNAGTATATFRVGVLLNLLA
jgi:hypothetical protein